MRLTRIRVQNFRALENIDANFDASVSVIIGPNATGKTTILEAVRLAKALLAPRTQNETNQVLISLGAMSPHVPQQIFSAALTSQPTLPLFIKVTYEITAPELLILRGVSSQLSNNVALRSIGQGFATPAQANNFLSSPLGIQAIQEATNKVNAELHRLDTNKKLEMNLRIDFASNVVAGERPIEEAFIQALDQALPPTKSIFSYFPADRSLPIGEIPVQIGISDAGNQLESHNSQPHIKYHRLKNTIYNAIIANDTGRADLNMQFQDVFSKILKGRSLGNVGVNRLGMLTIPIRDADSGAEFEIDGLSSGEKGIILTSILIAQTVNDGGIVLLDEPELHLNPAVCRELLQFFVEEFAQKRNIQIIICSHSAEILGGALEQALCALYHLRDGKTLARVRYQDQGEIRDALRRLGTSESEALLYKGTVSVEGIHDTEILQDGYGDLFRRFRLKSRGGRGAVEADIRELLRAEEKGEDVGSHFFIFDLDRQPSALTATAKVRFLQLNRYCIENFLLDMDILTDLSRDREYSDVPKPTVTDMRDILKALAMSQLNENVARLIFKDMSLESIAFDMSSVRAADSLSIALGLESDISRMQALLRSLTMTDFKSGFRTKFEQKWSELKPIWTEKWPERCNGKQLLEDLRKAGHFKGDLLKLKKQIIRRMRALKTDTYNSLELQLRVLVSTA